MTSLGATPDIEAWLDDVTPPPARRLQELIGFPAALTPEPGALPDRVALYTLPCFPPGLFRSRCPRSSPGVNSTLLPAAQAVNARSPLEVAGCQEPCTVTAAVPVVQAWEALGEDLDSDNPSVEGCVACPPSLQHPRVLARALLSEACWSTCVWMVAGVPAALSLGET